MDLAEECQVGRQAKSREKLTRAAIDKIDPPSSGRVFVYDQSITGLCICVTAAGTRTWYLYRKVDGRPVRLKLGRYPELPPDVARQLATEAAGRMAAGEDIQQKRSEKRQRSVTWSTLFRRYLSEHAKPHKKTWAEDEATEKRYLSEWSDAPLSSITKSVVSAKHRNIGKNAKFAANRILSLISKVFSFAIAEGIWTDNPAKGIKKYRERSRDRFILPAEMPQLITAIRKYPDKKLGDFFMLSLLIGARRSNMLAMAWRDVNLSSGVWLIPETKSGESAAVVIPDEATDILRRRQSSINPDDPRSVMWVFPSHGKTGHLTEPKKAWDTIRTSANLPGIRIHDLRRTLGSWQAAAGASLSVIGKSLGHKTQSATAVYARLQLDSVRESVQLAASAMMQQVDQSEKKN